MLCARCEQHNPEGARFCNQCGIPLAPSAAPELRRLTVMFCDLVGSVELANQLDPEDWHALLGAYQLAAAQCIRRHHGHVAQHLGDGLVAYFGYPVAGEDDAVRAVQAALELVQEVSVLPVPQSDARLRVRVGLHTGATMMGRVGGAEGDYLALGDTPNISARIQALAPSNAVLLSPATRTLVEARVRCVELGEYALKGVAAPQRLHRALAMRRADDQDKSTRGLAPMLGRGLELALLSKSWEQAASVGGCVLVLGEPGIGKSRLARELRSRVTQGDADAWLMRCSAHTANTPFAPLALFLRQAMAVAGAGQEEAAALAAVLASVGIEDESVAAPLRAMLAIAAPETAGAPTLSAQALRERTFYSVNAVLRSMASRRRTLLIVEDLHWSDPSTREWLGRLLKRELPAGLLLLLLGRAEFEADWADGPHIERMALGPCSVDDAAALVASLDPTGALAGAAAARIVHRAEGNPLFLEEFTRSALEAQAEDIPLTLQEQTMARLDRLGPAKQVLQQAAVIGRHFSRRQLCTVSGLGEEAVDRGLKRGIEAYMLRPLDAGGDAYAFHHALLRDAAYSSLLRSSRQASHARVAEAILAEDPASAERQPELLAQHYAEAGQVQAAIALWLKAGKVALGRSACVEAAAHARTALRLLGNAGDSEAALALELELRLVLAPALMTVHGVLDPQVERAYSRARALCERLGNGPKLLVPLWGLWAYELLRGEIDRARGIALQLRAVAEGSQHPVAALAAAATTGMTLFYQGDLRGARAECAQGLGQVRLPASAERTSRGVHDPGVMCHAFHGLAGWLLAESEPDDAVAMRDMAPALPPFDAAYAWCSDAVLHALAGDAGAACESAARAVAIGKEQGFPSWLLMGSILQGWGRARQGDTTTAIAQMRRSYDAWCASGARNLRPFFLALLADATLAAGDAAQAVRHADQGLAEAGTGEHVWDPELHRQRAEALAQLGEHAAALDSARLAIATADRMGARVWAERAYATLHRITREQAATT
jgi:class 3 adenylate cyclase/tetratricopeptide (TPR) repeat protein